MKSTIKDNRYSITFRNIHGIKESWTVTEDFINLATFEIENNRNGQVLSIEKLPFQAEV